MHESIRQQVGFIVSISVIKNAVKVQAVPKQQHITILFRTSHMLAIKWKIKVCSSSMKSEVSSVVSLALQK